MFSVGDQIKYIHITDSHFTNGSEYTCSATDIDEMVRLFQYNTGGMWKNFTPEMLKRELSLWDMVVLDNTGNYAPADFCEFQFAQSDNNGEISSVTEEIDYLSITRSCSSL